MRAWLRLNRRKLGAWLALFIFVLLAWGGLTWASGGDLLPLPLRSSLRLIDLTSPTPAAAMTPLPTLTLPAPELPPLPDPCAAIITSTAPTVQASITQTGVTAELISRELVTTTLAVPVADWTGGRARYVALAADGSVVAFTAVPPATDSAPDAGEVYDALYLYDRGSGELTLVSAAADGTPGNGWAGAPSLSADGSVVAFYAWAGNLVEDDTNAVQDAFVYDRRSQRITRVSVGPGGRQANGRAGDAGGAHPPALSADGRYVAFHAAASNLVDGDTNGASDIFLHDRTTGSTSLLSSGAGGAPANGASTQPHLSIDGRYVVFASYASNLDPAVPAQVPFAAAQIYWHDRATGATVLLSRGVDGRPGNGESRGPMVSGDGRYVAFSSLASNLVAGDTNQVEDVFLVDRETMSTRRISVADVGAQANRAAWSPFMTLDGRTIAFVSAASNLVSGDGNQVADLFVHDAWTRHTSRVSVAVVAPWTGREANGPTSARAALTVGGQLVAFVADADLAPPGMTGVPNLFLHERRTPPTYTISGRVVDAQESPLEGVTVAAGPQRTTTDAAGRYTLNYLVGGTYTLVAAKPGYTFSPARRTLSLLTDATGQDFIATAGAPGAFLDLPFAYDGTSASFLRILRDTDEGGLVDAWFDHDAPTYAKNNRIVLWDGLSRTGAAYNERLGCFERRCYDGHDGIDFPYRDPDPTTPALEPIVIHPAAAGAIAAVVDGCEEGDRRCNGGYGNEVILYHDNGYFTRYSHLGNVTVRSGPVTPQTPLGEMGATGNSYGVHLHFAVHHDNGNGRWDGELVDRPVDPFGWAGETVDPWTADYAGPVSQWLWRISPTAEVILLGSEGATLHDGTDSVRVEIPPGALAGQVRVELGPGSVTEPPPSPLRAIGRGFRLQLLDWLQADASGAPRSQPLLARPAALTVSYLAAATRHVDVEQLLLYRWDDDAGWLPLPTAIEPEAQVVYAATDRLGDFALYAPLRCPADGMEPDDGYDAARFVTLGDGASAASMTRLFDVAEDEDWVRFEAAAGATIAVTLRDLAPGVALTAAIYDHDGLTRLSSRAGAGELVWQAPAEGVYFVRVAPAPGSAVGCAATYTLSLTQRGSAD